MDNGKVFFRMCPGDPKNPEKYAQCKLIYPPNFDQMTFFSCRE